MSTPKQGRAETTAIYTEKNTCDQEVRAVPGGPRRKKVGQEAASLSIAERSDSCFVCYLRAADVAGTEMASLKNPAIPGEAQFDIFIYGAPPLAYPASLSQFVIYNTPAPAYG